MAIKELFYDNRPRVLLDPRASKRIDPRFTFTRDSTGTYVDSNGLIKTAAIDEPRFNHDPETGESLGLLIEESRTNIWTDSNDPTQKGTANVSCTLDSSVLDPLGNSSGKITITGVNTYQLWRQSGFSLTSGSYTFSVYLKAGTVGSVTLSSGNTPNAAFDIANGEVESETGCTAKIKPASNGWFRCSITWTATATTSLRTWTVNQAIGDYYFVAAAQVEAGSFPTSYIPTSGSTVTRDADLLSIEAPLPATGSVYIDARTIEVKENDTLLSLKNDSNDKIDLAYLSSTETYNSLALIANYDGSSKSSLPLPVPTTDRERNIITYGANNYQYGRDSSRFATSLSSSVPTGLNKLSIGHDAVDATKAFTGYINTVYAWSGELTPEVAEALVRGEIDAIDADTYSPTGPAGSLALVINTQGVGADGEKTFTLPAESVANDNDIVITWGDGTESGLDGAAAELGAVGLTHDYPAAGIYPVFVEEQLQNIKFNNSSSANDLLLIAAWGTGDMFTSPSTMNGAFYGCSQMDFSSSARTTNRPDTSAVTDWTSAFRDCSSITGTFPAFNFSAATSFTDAWRECSSMTSFVAAGDQTQNVTSFTRAWYNCNGLTSFPLINTSSGTSFAFAWNNCNSLTSFPLINTSSGTSFSYAWVGCSSLTSFPLIDTTLGTDFTRAWSGCSSLTSFPVINTSSGTNFGSTWYGCSSLTSFPVINTSSGTNFGSTWYGFTSLTSFPLLDTSSGTNFTFAWTNCNSLTSFPLLDTSSGTNFGGAWYNCTSLTSFPLIDTSSGTSFNQAWRDCSSLTSFPLLDTSSGTDFALTWYGCSSLTSFPLLDTSSGTNFGYAWYGCTSLTSFPLLTTSSGTGFSYAWYNCNGLTSFPLINTSSGTGFSYAWRGCTSLTSFPLLDTSSGTDFALTWYGCSSLTTFPANMFNTTGTLISSAFNNAWYGCALTAQSIENILVSLDTNGASNITLGISGGTNAGQSTWSTAANTAYTNLISKGWTISFNA